MADVYTRIGYIKGATGAQGAQGVKGDTGDAATIQVGTVTTVPYGQTANVVNSGTSGAAVFDFTIPQGKPGEQTTDMQNLTLGSITTSSASFPVPAVGETGKVLWGKVVKWFGDMSALVASKFNAANVVNNLTTTASGYALDARQGKTLQDQITSLNDSLTKARSNGTYNENFPVFAYGFITSSRSVMHLCIPMIFKVTASSISFSKLVASLRTSTGGYVVDDGTNIASYITQTTIYGDRGYVYLVLRKNDEWAVTNNTTFCGLVTIGYTIS